MCAMTRDVKYVALLVAEWHERQQQPLRTVLGGNGHTGHTNIPSSLLQSSWGAGFCGKHRAGSLVHMLQQPVGTSIGSISARCLTVDPCRYEDNFDAVNNVTIMSLPSDKGSIDSYGSPDKFLEQVGYLFGKQTFTGAGGGCSYPWGCVCGGGVRQVFF